MSKDIITLRDVRNEIRDLKEDLSEILKDHEVRLREGEGFRNRLYGTASVFTVFVSLAATWLWNKVFRAGG